MKCYRVLVRLQNDTDIINTWKDKETSDTGASASVVEKRDREPTPSKTPRDIKKSRKSTVTSTLPSRTSITGVGKTTLFLYSW